MRQPGQPARWDVRVVVVEKIGIRGEDLRGDRVKQVLSAGVDLFRGEMKIVDEDSHTHGQGGQERRPLVAHLMPIETIDIPEKNDDRNRPGKVSILIEITSIQEESRQIGSVGHVGVGRKGSVDDIRLLTQRRQMREYLSELLTDVRPPGSAVEIFDEKARSFVSVLRVGQGQVRQVKLLRMAHGVRTKIDQHGQRRIETR